MRKLVPVAAGVAVALGLGWVGATHWVGQHTETRYNAELDRILAALPFLAVEERVYQRNLLQAQARLVLRLKFPALPASTVDPDDEDRDDEGPDAAAGSLANPPIVRVVIVDRIEHGPFPGALLPAVARIRSTVTGSVVAADAAAPSAEQMLLTADTRAGFGQRFTSTFASPASDWTSDDGDLVLSWAGLTGESSGLLEPLQSRYTLRSAGLKAAGKSPDGGAGALILGAFEVQGNSGPSESLLIAPGEVRSTISEIRLKGSGPDGQGQDIVFNDLAMHSTTSRAGDLLEIGNRASGKGRIGDLKIDGFELVERSSRLHAPTLERLLQSVLSIYGAESPDEIQALVQPVLGEMKALLPHDPEYAMEKLALTVDGRSGTLAWRFGTKGATADMADNPLALLAAGNASIDVRLPREWVALLEAVGGEKAAAMAGGQSLIKTGEQLGFIRSESGYVVSAVRFADGNLEVNGQRVFTLPVSR